MVSDPGSPLGGLRKAGPRTRIETVVRNGLVAILILSGFWLFAELADRVVEGETHVLDRALLLEMRNPSDLSDPLGPLWVEEMFRDFSALGGPAVLTFLTLAAAGFLALERKWGSVVLLLVAVGGGVLLVTLLKLGFGRPRPDLVPHAVPVYTNSFPSGHSNLSAVTYLTLGGLLAQMDPRPWVRPYLLGLAVLLTLLVGTSRIYLGVHWPTDVLAGWIIGASWAMLCWAVAAWLEPAGPRGPKPGREEPPARPQAARP